MGQLLLLKFYLTWKPAWESLREEAHPPPSPLGCCHSGSHQAASGVRDVPVPYIPRAPALRAALRLRSAPLPGPPHSPPRELKGKLAASDRSFFLGQLPTWTLVLRLRRGTWHWMEPEPPWRLRLLTDLVSVCFLSNAFHDTVRGVHPTLLTPLASF